MANGDKSGNWLRAALPVAVAVMLPGVGFLGSQVIGNGRAVAVLERTQLTLEGAVRLIREHEGRGVHAGAATQTELREAIQAAVAGIEKQQRIRDENMNRRLDRIEQALQK